MTAGTGHAACPRSPAPRVAPEFLVIVARDHAELFPRTRRQFLEDARVQVILDRRQLEGRHRVATEAPDRRSPAARRGPRYSGELRRDLEERDNELMRLRAEVERLTRERAAIAEAVGAAMRTIDRLDVLGRSPEARTEARTVDTRAAARYTFPS